MPLPIIAIGFDVVISWLDPAGAIVRKFKEGQENENISHRLLVLLSVFVAQSSIAQQGINAPPDAIFYNGKVIQSIRALRLRRRFAVRGEQFVAVGSNAAVQALAGANTRSVDLKGSAVIPGLSDNHDHLYNSAKVMRGIDLVGATSTAEVVRRLRDGLAKAKAGEAVFGSVGWRAPLTRNDLDRYRPMFPSWR